MTSQTPFELEYQFTPTQDWFTFNIDIWRPLFNHIKTSTPRVLEIGSWEGRSATFLLNNLCIDGGNIVCIDHFDLMQTQAGIERYHRLTNNLTLTQKPFRVIPEFSFTALTKLLEEEIGKDEENAGFDWIYVDGSHEADDTFLDGEMVWRVAKRGAIVIFDDYRWDKEPEDSVHHPRRGIDAFLKLHEGQYNILSSPEQYQKILQKTSDMRIGFLTVEKNDSLPGDIARRMDYGVNVAFTIDSAYALPAAVAIRGITENTPGRVIIYIVDCGLTREDKGRLTALATSNVTFVFCALPENSLTRERGAIWAKIDMISRLPIERVLYLDADTLVLADIRELWDMDLKGASIAAAQDVGFPNGHTSLKLDGAPYFNAGVLLMDLARIRRNFDQLMTLSRTMEDARFLDQDTLNVHFANDWEVLSLMWNAQGLGTYADCPSADRDTMDLGEMNTYPRIVHFTGPVHPSIAEVLNPYMQPFTAKPWGYAGAPGHPYASVWWEVVEMTGWKGWGESAEYGTLVVEKMDEKIEEGIRTFREALPARLSTN